MPVSGRSPTLTQAFGLMMQYLGLRGQKRVTQEPISAVLSDGTLVLGNGSRVRTSGDARGMRAGDRVPVVWSREQGNRRGGVVPAMALVNQIRPGAPGPSAKRGAPPVGVGVEELLVVPTAPPPAEIYFRNADQCVPLGVRARLDPSEIITHLVWGQRDNTFAVGTVKGGAHVFRVFQLGRPAGRPYRLGEKVTATLLKTYDAWTIPVTAAQGGIDYSVSGASSGTLTYTFYGADWSTATYHYDPGDGSDATMGVSWISGWSVVGEVSATITTTVSTAPGAGGAFTPTNGVGDDICLTDTLDLLIIGQVTVEVAKITSIYSPATALAPADYHPLDGIYYAIDSLYWPTWVSYDWPGQRWGHLRPDVSVLATFDLGGGYSMNMLGRNPEGPVVYAVSATRQLLFNLTAQTVEYAPQSTMVYHSTVGGSTGWRNVGWSASVHSLTDVGDVYGGYPNNAPAPGDGPLGGADTSTLDSHGAVGNVQGILAKDRVIVSVGDVSGAVTKEIRTRGDGLVKRVPLGAHESLASWGGGMKHWLWSKETDVFWDSWGSWVPSTYELFSSDYTTDTSLISVPANPGSDPPDAPAWTALAPKRLTPILPDLLFVAAEAERKILAGWMGPWRWTGTSLNLPGLDPRFKTGAKLLVDLPAGVSAQRFAAHAVGVK